MLIIAKKSEKDYYDGVVGTMGIDKTIVYKREIVEIEEDKFPDIFNKKKFSFGKSKDNSIITLASHSLSKDYRLIYEGYGHFVVGFCGKLYIGFKLYRKELDNGVIKLNTIISYDTDAIKKVITSRSYWGNNVETDIDNVKKMDLIQMFRDFNAPVFVYDGDYDRTFFNNRWYNNKQKLIINPILADYQFYKVFDSFHTFQEISMFMGGVLGKGEKDIVEVADKYKIEQHGFDKWSFRKEKELKK